MTDQQDTELTDEQIATVVPGLTQVIEAQESDRDGTDADGTDGDASDGTDGDAKDADSTDAQDADGTDTQDADGTDAPSTS